MVTIVWVSLRKDCNTSCVSVWVTSLQCLVSGKTATPAGCIQQHHLCDFHKYQWLSGLLFSSVWYLERQWPQCGIWAVIKPVVALYLLNPLRPQWEKGHNNLLPQGPWLRPDHVHMTKPSSVALPDGFLLLLPQGWRSDVTFSCGGRSQVGDLVADMVSIINIMYIGIVIVVGC